MKAVLAIFGLILCLLIFEKSWANEPAYRRECRIVGGIYWSVSVKSEFDTNLCLFGDAVIGAEEFAQLKSSGNRSQSLVTFAASAPSAGGNSVCQAAGAQWISGVDTDGKTWNLCLFSDSSILGVETLSRGQKDPSNAALSAALGLN